MYEVWLAEHLQRVKIFRKALAEGDSQDRTLAQEMLDTWGDENMRVRPLPVDAHVSRLATWRVVDKDPLATDWDKKLAKKLMLSAGSEVA